MGDYREGMGTDDLVDLNDMDDDIGGAEDLTRDMCGVDETFDIGGGEVGVEDYGNVGSQAQPQGVGSQIGAFFEEEFKNGLSAFGAGGVEAFKALGQLPLGSLGGMWAGWLLYGVIGLVAGFIGSVIAKKALGAESVLRNIMNAFFYSGGLCLITGGVTGLITTMKLLRGESKLFATGDLFYTEKDEEEDSADGYDAIDDDIGALSDDEEDMESTDTENPYDIYNSDLPEIDTGAAISDVDNNSEVQVNNVPIETINRELDNMNAMAAMGDREIIYKIACDILPSYSPNFADITDIEPNSNLWNAIQTKILAAIQLSTGIDEDEIPCQVKSIKKSMISFSIVCTRFNKMKSDKQLEDFDKELASLFDASSGDIVSAKIVGDESKISCRTTLNGPMYNIVIINPKHPLISLGDILRTKTCKEFMLGGKSKLPICLGLDDLGQMVLWDTKGDTASMVCGQTRSGKSWFTAYYFLTMMIVKKPTEVQYIFIDPKNTDLYASLATMPHAMGLHAPAEGDPDAAQNLIDIIKEVVEKEGERRKRLFKEAGAENYWDYIEANGSESLPLLTIVIDEFISVVNLMSEIKDMKPKFFHLVSTLVTKMPAYGLRLLIIPHRVPGTVPPEIRDLMKFKATFKSTEELSTANLGLKRVGIPLMNTGDMAWVREGSDTPISTHTLGVAKNDELMKKCIKLIAKAYYKLNCDVPDMSYMKKCYTRNDEEIINSLKNVV